MENEILPLKYDSHKYKVNDDSHKYFNALCSAIAHAVYAQHVLTEFRSYVLASHLEFF